MIWIILGNNIDIIKSHATFGGVFRGGGAGRFAPAPRSCCFGMFAYFLYCCISFCYIYFVSYCNSYGMVYCILDCILDFLNPYFHWIAKVSANSYFKSRLHCKNIRSVTYRGTQLVLIEECIHNWDNAKALESARRWSICARWSRSARCWCSAIDCIKVGSIILVIDCVTIW